MIGVPSFDNRITEVRHGMGELYVMRRANGDIFAEQVNGNLVIPVWSSKDEVARYLLQQNSGGRHRPATEGEPQPTRLEAIREAPGPLTTGSVR